MSKPAHRFLAGAAVALTLLAPAANAYESSAKEAILVDLTGHRVLYEKNADQHMPTSSMSKMMTIYNGVRRAEGGQAEARRRVHGQRACLAADL